MTFSERMKRVAAAAVSFFVISCAATDGIQAGQMEITVDVSKDVGESPPILNGSVWVSDHIFEAPAYIVDRLFEDLKPSTVQLTLIPILRSSQSFNDFKKDLRENFSRPAAASLVRHARENRTLVIIGYDPCPIPSWLSSRPGDSRKFRAGGVGGNVHECSPPKDYELWGQVVRETLQYLKSLGLENLGFYVGHEQDVDWIGSEASFYKYYEETAKAAKSVDGRIKVGGPGTIGWDAKRPGCDSEKYAQIGRDLCRKTAGWKQGDGYFTEDFIKSVSRAKAPLDFINWHSFGSPPALLAESAAKIRGWLEENGFGREVELYPSDWTYWSDAYTADYLDTEESAAYIPMALYYMWKGGVGIHGYDFNVRNDGMERSAKKAHRDSTFIGDWALFTRAGMEGGGVVKPSYNALKAASMMRDSGATLLPAQFSEGRGLAAFSVLKGKTVYLLATNFTPASETKLFRFLLLDSREAVLLTDEEIRQLARCIAIGRKDKTGKGAAECRKRLVSQMKDPGKTETVDYISRVYMCVKEGKGAGCVRNAGEGLKHPENRALASRVEEALLLRSAPRKVKVKFTGIPFSGKARVTTYTIDSSNSNACSFNKRTEPSQTQTPCGIGGAVDRAVWEARESAAREGMKAARSFMEGQGYSKAEIDSMANTVKKCRQSNTFQKCMGDSIGSMAARAGVGQQKARADFRAAYEEYRDAFNDSYFGAVDIVNRRDEVSLEGSRRSSVVDVDSGGYAMELEMEPNSVWLLTITAETK